MSGIYIHIPFCKQACHYCDFHFSTSMGKKEAMLAAIKRELELRKKEFVNDEVATIYFGGGTPSVLETEEINTLIETVYAHYTVSKQPEITLEANPDDLSLEKIMAIAQSKVNRLSIGVQSFFEEDLKLMNRAHTSTMALQSIKDAQRYFDNISIDLIYGMPNMSLERWQQNMQYALDLNVPHISSYALTVEPKTALHSFIKKGVMAPLNDELAAAHFETLVTTLETAGFVQYEISNFGKPNYFSKNNTAYWLGKKYIGVGPSAHSFSGETRSWNINSNPKYIAALQQDQLPAETETLSLSDRYNEYMMTGLRTVWGVSLIRVKNEFGSKYYDYLLQQIKPHMAKKRLLIDKETLLVTKEGKFLSDGIASDLFMLNLE